MLGIAIAAATFMGCSFVLRHYFVWVRGSSKEQRHEAEEGEEIEEVSPVWLMHQTAGHRFGRLPFLRVDTLASGGHLPVIICRTLQAKPRVVAQRLKRYVLAA